MITMQLQTARKFAVKSICTDEFPRKRFQIVITSSRYNKYSARSSLFLRKSLFSKFPRYHKALKWRCLERGFDIHFPTKFQQLPIPQLHWLHLRINENTVCTFMDIPINGVSGLGQRCMRVNQRETNDGLWCNFDLRLLLVKMKANEKKVNFQKIFTDEWYTFR